MHPLLQQEDDQERRLPITPARVFLQHGEVSRKNYRRQWWGKDYIIRCGKFNGSLLSDITSESWLLWALNQFEGQLEQHLERALVDQLNSLHV